MDDGLGGAEFLDEAVSDASEGVKPEADEPAASMVSV